MMVGYIHPREGLHHGNLRWLGKWPMVRGIFPPGHPAAPRTGANGTTQLGDSPELRLFRMRGYWASCFPEGDGITFQLPDPSVTPEQGATDVRECFPTWSLILEDEFRRHFDLWQKEQALRERLQRRAYVEARERAATGKCSKIIRFSVFCSLSIGHGGPCVRIEPSAPIPTKKQCCPRCGNWLLPGRTHQCGDGPCL